MKTNYSIFSLLLMVGLGLSIANAAMPSNSPIATSPKDGIFYTYFVNISKTSPTTPNPFLVGFTPDYTISHGDGNNLIKGYLGTLGGNPTDIVTGFDAGGNITKTTISTVTKKYLGDNAGAGLVGEGIIGFYPNGLPIYSKEIGFWNQVGGILSYNGGVQIGSIMTSSLNVGGNITVSSTPAAADDLITKGFADAYMKDICIRFLGSWDDGTATCSSGTIPGPTCIPHACNATTPACGTTTTGTSDSCGSPCSKTGPVCTGPNSCAATPSCNGVSCTTIVGTPTSIGQAWTKTGPNCKFTCTGGYTGNNCEIPPLPPGYTVPGSCGEQNVWDGGLNCMAGEPTYIDCASTERAFYQTSDTTKSCIPMNLYSYAGKKGKCIADSSCSAPSCGLKWTEIAPSGCLPNNVSYIGDGMVGYETYETLPCTTPNQIIRAGAGDKYGFCPVGTWGVMTMKCSLDSSCGTNSCAATPACDGVGCTTTVGTPTSVGQTWTKGAANCGFNCKPGYTGANCEIAPTPTGGNCSVLYYQLPMGATNDLDIAPGTSHTFGANIGFTVIGSDLIRVGQKFTCPATTGPSWIWHVKGGGPSAGPETCTSKIGVDVDTIADGDTCYTYKPTTVTCRNNSNEIYQVNCGGVSLFSAPSCSDGIQNGSETGKDCGGSCGSCTWSCPGAPPYGACYDSPEKPYVACNNNGDTTTIYGNGSYCSGPMGVPVSGSFSCTCKQGTAPVASCTDGIQNGTETGIDCGGGSCAACTGKVDAICGAAFTCNAGTLDMDSKEATPKESYPRGCYYDWYCNGTNGGAGVACNKTTGCFAPEELVTTPSGLSQISSLKVGDKVISYNESTKQFIENTIDKVIIHDGKLNPIHDFAKYPLMRLTTQVNGIKKYTQVTANHLYYSPDENTYKEIKDFNFGERIKSIDGIGYIESIIKLTDTPVVYNLHMSKKPNNYLVNGIVVHNEKADSCIGCSGATCDTSTAWSACIPDGSCSAAAPACGTTTTGVDSCGNSCSKVGDPCASVSVNGTCGYLTATQGNLCLTGTAGQLYDFWGDPVYGYVSGGGGDYYWTCKGEGFGTDASCNGTAYWGMGH